MEKTDLAYIAGILDGEGSIMIRRRRDEGMRLGYCYQLFVNIANTNDWLLNWVQFNFGGSIYKNHKPCEHYKQVYQWQISSCGAETFLKALLPYLKIKRPQAEIALKFQLAKQHNVGQKPKSDKEYVLEEAQRILVQSYNDNRRQNILIRRREIE